MKKVIVNIVVMLILSSLLFGIILLAILPKGKYSDNISLNVASNVSQKYTSIDIYSEDFEKSIDIKNKDPHQHNFDASKNDYLKHMNGNLTIKLSNKTADDPIVFTVYVKNHFPFKTLSLIEIHENNVTVNYKYNFLCLFLLFEIPTAAILTIVILRNTYLKKKDNSDTV